MSGTITILRCARSLRLAKLIRPGEIVIYDQTRTYDGWTVPVSGLADIESLISKIISNPRLCVVRGKLAGGDRVEGMRRLLYRDAETGDEPTLIDVPRQWLALDIEGVQRPQSCGVADLAACARVAMAKLPGPFKTAACLVQATAGHGIKPDLRLRLWFWLSRPTNGAELKRWLKGCPADHSVFGAAQIIYTAAPVFDGLEDHLPSRLAMLPGDAEVKVPSSSLLTPPPAPAARPTPGPDSPHANSYAWAALRNAVARAAAAPTDSRHPTCLSQALALARFVQAGTLAASDVRLAMGEALQRAGKTKDEGEKLAAWALSHPAGGAR